MAAATANPSAKSHAATPAPTTGTTRLTYGQIEALWIRGGGSRALAPLMAAIAMAETGGTGDYTALNNNPSTGDYSVGLWQINYFGKLLGPRSQAFGSPGALRGNPMAQAKAAVTLAQGGRGLSNWTTYTKGAYQNYYRTNVPPDSSYPTSQDVSFWKSIPIPGLGGIPWGPNVGPKNPIAGAGGSILNALIPDWLNVHNTARAGQAVAGFVFIILGVIIVAREASSSSPAQSVGQAASDASGAAWAARGAAWTGARRARGRATGGSSRRVRALRTSPGTERMYGRQPKAKPRGTSGPGDFPEGY